MQSRLLEKPQRLKRQLRHQAALFVISLSVSLEREIDYNVRRRQFVSLEQFLTAWQQPIAFVVHSLGGIIVKDVLSP
jgi:hypothetical protein